MFWWYMPVCIVVHNDTKYNIHWGGDYLKAVKSLISLQYKNNKNQEKLLNNIHVVSYNLCAFRVVKIIKITMIITIEW